ncbi:sulfite oxidase heme-binding subunit YedZ [Parapedomonas caeni]
MSNIRHMPRPPRPLADRRRQRDLLKRGTFILLLMPLVWLVLQWGFLLTTGGSALGVNPIEASIRFTGEWALRALLLTLAVSPLARFSRWTPVMSIRRMLGLYTFTYAALHFCLYFGFDKELSVADVVADVLKRWYITLGMGGLLLLIPLAATSSAGAIRRLGGRRWQRLHRAVYAIGALACAHFVLLVKGNQLEPWVYAGIFALLMILRLIPRSTGPLPTTTASAPTGH